MIVVLRESGGMAQDVSVIVSAEDRARLAEVAGDRSRPLMHVQRAGMVLLYSERLPVAEGACRAVPSRPTIWR